MENTKSLVGQVLSRQSIVLFWGLCALTFVGVLGAVLLDEILLAGLPLVAIGAYIALMDIRAVFWVLLACIPISMEVSIGSFGTDLPDEPLIVLLMLITFVYVLAKPTRLSVRVLYHPLTVLVLLSILTIMLATFFAENVTLAVKYLLAKIWYVVTFVFLATMLLRDERDWRAMFWAVFATLFPATLKVIGHHALMDFGFREINEACQPFFRNHVTYAAILSLFMPFCWYMWRQQARWSLLWYLLLAGMATFLLGISLSYTRAAYLALVGGFGSYLIFRWQLMRYCLAAGSLVVIVAVAFFVQNSRYLDFAPSERTIAHESFSDIVSATSKLEDVSTMERYYRWVAAGNMVSKRPWLGYGPSNFYSTYKHHTLVLFYTYVSDNPEKSTTHNYFLMILVEQGIIGFVVIMALFFATLLIGERVYRQSRSPERRYLVIAALMSTVVIDLFLLINDLVETDKIGSFFYINIAIIIAMDILNKQPNTSRHAS